MWCCRSPPRREEGGACDHRRPLPDCVVAILEGREGGRPGSPVGPVTPATRLPCEARLCDLERKGLSPSCCSSSAIGSSGESSGAWFMAGNESSPGARGPYYHCALHDMWSP